MQSLNGRNMPQRFDPNPVLGSDSYKFTQWPQYPKDTRFVYSYMCARGGFWKHALWNGLQGLLINQFEGQFFTEENVHAAARWAAKHFFNDKVFNYHGWLRLLEKHEGRLPLRIRAVPEGTLVPVRNVLMTVENTDDEFPWLTNWAETRLMRMWYPVSVGTLSFEIRQAIGKDLVRTGSPELIDYKLHDFGDRGVSSEESAAIGGAAHLFNFHGTDTPEAIQWLQQYYTADMPGNSIPAMEHSTVTSWGKDHEVDSYRNMLDTYPTGLAACVIDSYDTHNAVDKIFGEQLREKVLRRNGTVVLRPDSGDPTVVLEDMFNSIAEKFGFETNNKGWKVLPSQIRAIQGDGVNYQNILRINSHLIRNGWSMDNWAYGMGGALLQQQNRDTMRFAIKCCAIDRGGVWHDVYKDPATDRSKASIGGRLSLVDRSVDGSGDFVTVQDPSAYGNVLQTIFEDGKILARTNYDEVWARTRKNDRYVEEAIEAYA
jgi:nicotinamide phosphoribosyltransferase